MGGRELTSRFLVPWAYRELYENLKEKDYDIIHAHGLDSPMALTFFLISGKIHVPVVITNHSPTGNSLIGIPLRLAGKLFLRHTDVVITVSSTVEKDTRAMTDRPVYLIHNGIDILPQSMANENLCFNKDGRTVITDVSRMIRKKRVFDIIGIASKLIERNQDLLFLMVGDGPLKHKLEKEMKKQNMVNNFVFTGQVSRETVLSLLESSDIFIIPSKDEAFGISVLKAFTKKVPAIAMNNSGVADIVAHEKTGLLAEDTGEIIQCVEKLIDGPTLRSSLSAAAFRGLGEYRWTDIAKRTEAVYDQVITGKDFNYD